MPAVLTEIIKMGTRLSAGAKWKGVSFIGRLPGGYGFWRKLLKGAGLTQTDELIDVRELMAASSIEEHCRMAENYFARLTDWTYHLAKPFCSFDDTPQLLINFAVVLQGLQLCPGLTVLEFGAGTCWAARTPFNRTSGWSP